MLTFGVSGLCANVSYTGTQVGFTPVSVCVTIAIVVFAGVPGCPPGPHSLDRGAPVSRGLVTPPPKACDSLKMKLSIPFQDQYGNSSGKGWRECFTSSVAMLLMHRKAVASDDAYAKIRDRYGDTTSAGAHLTACKALGQQAIFTQTFSRHDLEQQIARRNPVAVGWLHQGRCSAPQPGGHWSVVTGTDLLGTFQHDPAGEAQLVGGGHIRGLSGRSVHYSWKHWGPRWEVEGPGSGWAFYLKA